MNRIILILIFLFLPLNAFGEHVYKVKRGDNLYDLAVKFNTTVKAIKRQNGLRSSTLQIGDGLIIPGLDGANEQTSQIVHVVARGDTLSEIAQKYGSSVKKIMRANRKKSTRLYIGQKLNVPVSPSHSFFLSSSGETSRGGEYCNVNAVTNMDTLTIEYRIKRGDSLGKIASKFGVGVEDIKKDNGLRGNRIIAGKTLQISGVKSSSTLISLGESSYGTYVVKSGDTLSEIADKYNVSVTGLKKSNNIRGHLIRIGQKLKVPASGRRASHCIDPTNDVIVRVTDYKVKRGDSLSKISHKFGISISSLKETNGLKGNMIRVGRNLKIFVNDKRGVSHAKSSSGKATKKSKSIGVGLILERLLEGNGLLGDKVVKLAQSFMGSPYRFGGNSLVKGIDCSAFVKTVFKQFDINLPRTARELYKVGMEIKRNELQTADLIFFQTYARYPSHVGIYIGDNKFIHASSRAKQVTISDIQERYYVKRYIGAKRLNMTPEAISH